MWRTKNYGVGRSQQTICLVEDRKLWYCKTVCSERQQHIKILWNIQIEKDVMKDRKLEFQGRKIEPNFIKNKRFYGRQKDKKLWNYKTEFIGRHNFTKTRKIKWSYGRWKQRNISWNTERQKSFIEVRKFCNCLIEFCERYTDRAEFCGRLKENTFIIYMKGGKRQNFMEIEKPQTFYRR